MILIENWQLCCPNTFCIVMHVISYCADKAYYTCSLYVLYYSAAPTIGRRWKHFTCLGIIRIYIECQWAPKLLCLLHHKTVIAVECARVTWMQNKQNIQNMPNHAPNLLNFARTCKPNMQKDAFFKHEYEYAFYMHIFCIVCFKYA